MDDDQRQDLMRKLTKRGFKTDATRELCPACGVTAMHIYRLVSRLGGRDVQWCMACDATRSVRRSADDKLSEDVGFDLVAFLSKS